MPLGDFFWIIPVLLPIIIIAPIGLHFQGRVAQKQQTTIDRLKRKLKRCHICGHNEFEFGKPGAAAIVVVFEGKRQYRIATKCKKCGCVTEFVEP